MESCAWNYKKVGFIWLGIFSKPSSRFARIWKDWLVYVSTWHHCLAFSGESRLTDLTGYHWCWSKLWRLPFIITVIVCTFVHFRVILQYFVNLCMFYNRFASMVVTILENTLATVTCIESLLSQFYDSIMAVSVALGQ